jgi:hypothetical protein
MAILHKKSTKLSIFMFETLKNGYKQYMGTLEFPQNANQIWELTIFSEGHVESAVAT